MNMKKILKKTLKYALRILLGIVIFLLLYAGTHWMASNITVGGVKDEDASIDIYIKSNGVHTDIVVPTKNEYKDWSKDINVSDTKIKYGEYKYLALGWGDKGFYLNTPTWADLKFSTAFKAAFWMNTTAMHTEYHERMKLGKNCKKITISPRQYKMLIKFIDDSFEKNNGKYDLIKTDKQYGMTDSFYEANGTYCLFYSCNTWANQALKSCEQKACWWTLMDDPIFIVYSD